MWAGLPFKLRILLVTMVIANIGSAIFWPFMALYVKDLGADVGEVGLYFTIMSVAPVGFRILGGWISDNLGRVQTVAIGSIAGVIGFAGLWLAPTWLWLIPGGLVMHLGRSLVGPSFRAYTAECADESQRAQVFGFTSSVFLICQIIGPVLGGYIAKFYTYRQLFAIATAFIAAATVLRVWNAWDLPFRLGRLKPAALGSDLKRALALIFGGGLLTWILAVDTFGDFGTRLSDEFFSLFQKEIGGLGDDHIGWLSSIGAITTAVLLVPSGWLSDRIGERRMMVIGATLGAGALVVFANAHSFAGFLVATLLLNTTWALYGPAYNSLLSKAVPTSQLGITYGFFETAWSLVATPAPYIGGLLWEGHSPRTPFYITAAVSLATVVPIWFKFRLPAREGETSPEPAEGPPG